MSVEYGSGTDEVVIEFPVGAGYLPVIRSAAAAVAVANDLSTDDLEDLRLAVDELGAMLVGFAAPRARARCGLRVTKGDFTVVMTAAADPHGQGDLPSNALGWQILTVLGDLVDLRVDERDQTNELTFTFVRQRRSGS